MSHTFMYIKSIYVNVEAKYNFSSILSIPMACIVDAYCMSTNTSSTVVSSLLHIANPF